MFYLCINFQSKDHIAYDIHAERFEERFQLNLFTPTFCESRKFPGEIITDVIHQRHQLLQLCTCLKRTFYTFNY